MNGDRKVTKEQIDKAIAKAKLLLQQQRDLRYEIVKIAQKVCVLKKGGRVWNDEYTMGQFALDIGVAPKTMYRWNREYTHVLAKIGDAKFNRKALEETLKKVKSNTDESLVKTIYEAEASALSTNENARLADAVKRLRNIDFFINHAVVLSKLDTKNLEAASSVSKKIHDGIEEFFSGKRKGQKRSLKRDEAFNMLANIGR